MATPSATGATCSTTLRRTHAHDVTAVAITPGFLRSEAVLDHFGVTETKWRDAIAQDPYFAESETPCFVGRAVAALAADPDVHRKNGRLLSSWDLADEYDFDDLDGRRPEWGRFFRRQVLDIVKRRAPPDDFDRFVVRTRLHQTEHDASLAGERRELETWLARHG